MTYRFNKAGFSFDALSIHMLFHVTISDAHNSFPDFPLYMLHVFSFDLKDS